MINWSSFTVAATVEESGPAEIGLPSGSRQSKVLGHFSAEAWAGSFGVSIDFSAR